MWLLYLPPGYTFRDSTRKYCSHTQHKKNISLNSTTYFGHTYCPSSGRKIQVQKEKCYRRISYVAIFLLYLYFSTWWWTVCMVERIVENKKRTYGDDVLCLFGMYLLVTDWQSEMEMSKLEKCAFRTRNLNTCFRILTKKAARLFPFAELNGRFL